MRWYVPLLLISIGLLAGCAGEQSALSGGGQESDRTLLLTIILTAGSAVIFLLVIAAIAAAFFAPVRVKRWLASNNIVIWGGIAFPTVVLSALLVYGFLALGAGPASSATAAGDPLRIRVDGLQWWWRVTYLGNDGEEIESANELRLPAGRTVQLELTSSDVIHSFWVPAYAGKVDMIPGRTNTLTLVAEEPGIVRGQCTEYCGGAHAFMAFSVVTMDPADFDAWLAEEAGPANLTGTQGERAFLQAGCGGCHTVRGTSARGSVGPDLTHVASRRTIGAGLLPTDRDAILTWLKRHKSLKPDNLMPAYDMLSEEEQASIADWLGQLE